MNSTKKCQLDFFEIPQKNYTLSTVQNHDQLFEPQTDGEAASLLKEIPYVYQFHKVNSG